MTQSYIYIYIPIEYIPHKFWNELTNSVRLQIQNQDAKITFIFI